MNGLIYNNYIRLDGSAESALIHSSYLLMNKTIAAGSSRQLYQHFLKRNENIKGKLKFLEDMFRGHSGFEDVQQAIKTFKDFKKIKHPSASVIAAHKKFQKHFEAEYENQTRSHINTIDEMRLINMDELAPHGYFDWYHINDELLQVPGEKHASVPEILQLLPGQFGSEPFLFVLPISLFTEASRFDESYRCDAALPSFMENLSFLHTCFELPNVLMLTHNELHAVKMQVQDVFQPFNKAMDSWLQRCMEDKSSSSQVHFFKTEVLPVAETFKKALQQNSLLNQHSIAGTDNQKMYFSLGEMSMSEVWRLFRERLVIGDEVWNEMTDLMKEPKYQQRRPVLFFTVFCPNEDEEQKTNEAIPFRKKSLVID